MTILSRLRNDLSSPGGDTGVFGDLSRIAPDITKDPVFAALKLRQHRNVTRRQLLDAGLNDNAIAHRVRRGWLYRAYPGVYSVGGPPTTALEQAAAAVLACGPAAALSHRSALALWDLAGWPTSVAEVVSSADRRPHGIRVHLCRTLVRRDFRTRHGIRVTSPARTVLDCAPGLTDMALARAVNEMRLAKLLGPAQLEDVLLRCPTHPGSRRLRRFIDPETGPTRSELEDAFLNFCARYELPRPKVNIRVGDYEVDAYFEAEKLIVELDSYSYHSDRAAFERDRTRDLDATAAGIETVRVTHRQITKQPDRLAARLHKILHDRRA